MTPYIPLGHYRQLLVAAFFMVAIWYLLWRLGSFNREAMVFSVALYVAEVYGLIGSALHVFMVSRLTRRDPLPVIEGKTVDVYITTINEPVDLIRKTIIAAKNMDYDHVTWLLDDGHRPEMKKLAEQYGIRYLARETNEHAKAGNLNYAYEHSDGDFICIFDADHCPQRNFITNTIGYFADDNVAFVQTPQDFYNLDSYQHRQGKGEKRVWTEQSLFFRVIQRGKDYWNAAFFCGSCAIVRRTALDAIGGFATGTLTEDLHTSIRLHKKGYRSIYMQQSMAYGVAPSNIAPFLSQRVRWGQGAMQVWKMEGILTAKGLTMAQRLNYLASVLTYFDGWQKGLFYLSPAIVLFTGVMPIDAINSEFLMHFIPFYLLSYLVFEEVGRGYGKMFYIEQYNFGRFFAFAWATLAWFGNNSAFKVTDKSLSQSQVNKRILMPQLLVISVNVFAIPLGCLLYYVYGYLPIEGVIANVVWALINSGVAFSLLSFTKNVSRFKRNDYRFPINLPARVTIGEETTYVTVDNISSSGCKFYGAFPETLKMGDTLSGQIALPSGELLFHGIIAARLMSPPNDKGEHYIKGIGCHFDWEKDDNQDDLDLFLYGSDLQWTLHHLTEESLTPFEWLVKKFKKQEILKQVRADFWGAVRYHYAAESEDRSSMGLIAHDVHTHGSIVITFTPLRAGEAVVFGTYSRMPQPDLVKQTELVETLESPSATLYVYKLVDFIEQEDEEATGAQAN
ncbi:MAG: glycosyltransferase [Gammaproteobacteria bacterium]|nr:glycosyltransferase [Gammaproteobacteria bacterium]